MNTTVVAPSEMMPQMPLLPDANDLDATLDYLGLWIDRLLAEPDFALDVTSYTGCYTAVVNYSISLKGSTKRRQRNTQDIGTLGGDLYQFLITRFDRHAAELTEKAKSYHDETFLQFYLEGWDRYVKSSRLIDRIFKYFNRHWMGREYDEGKPIPVDVFTVGLVRWHEKVFRPLASDLARVVREVPEECRVGEWIEPSRIKAIMDEIGSPRAHEQPSSKSDSSQRTRRALDRGKELRDQLFDAFQSGLGINRLELRRLIDGKASQSSY